MRGQCVVALPSARMRSEGYGSCRVCQSTALIYSVLVAQLDTRQTGHTNGLSIVVAPEFILAFSYNRFVLKIAIALSYLQAHGSRPCLYAKRALFSAILPYTLVIARVQ